MVPLVDNTANTLPNVLVMKENECCHIRGIFFQVLPESMLLNNSLPVDIVFGVVAAYITMPSLLMQTLTQGCWKRVEDMSNRAKEDPPSRDKNTTSLNNEATIVKESALIDIDVQSPVTPTGFQLAPLSLEMYKEDCVAHAAMTYPD
jgi:hypothetical protein